MSKILVVNCGSSSLKYQIFSMPEESVVGKGGIERIGQDGAFITHRNGDDGEKTEIKTPMNNHSEAIKVLFDTITDSKIGCLKDMKEINAVGHRVVHGGEKYTKSVLIDADVIKGIKDCADFAPLHNPANLLGIEACKKIIGNVPMVAVFDTAFHQTMAQEVYMYALPYEYYDKYGIRVYGFHGTSHKYVSERASNMLGRGFNSLKIVTCHLGNGASISAIKDGKSVDTSMGFTPLQGLVMGTRAGSIDPAIIEFIAKKENKNIEQIMEILNKKSGVLGISGVGSDFRDIEEAMSKGNERAELAMKMFAYKIKFYIGAYIALMNGIDALVFTAGIGENDISARDIICADLENLGIKLDPIKNRIRGKEAVISKDDSDVSILLIPTNEEVMIARDTISLISK